MKNSLVKFIYDNEKDKDTFNKHWEYCCAQKIPCIRIIKSGTKFWQIEFDVLSVTLRERFVIMNYTEHIIPLYNLYGRYSKLPSNKYSAAGGGRNLIFTVHKKDAPALAKKLFDLLELLSKRDQELFDENPFTIDKEGFNCEGTHVDGFKETLNKMPDKNLISEYQIMKKDNPTMLQTIELINNEIVKRKL